MNSLFSIIVPIYKIEKHLNQCVESIVNQTYKNLEIILVDDGSPDNCPAICDEWAKKNERIKVIHKKNEGLIAARKSGVRIAAGDYVCFVDGDDWIEPDMYEKIAKSIEQYNPDCVITQFYYSYTDNEEKSDYKLNRIIYNRSELENEVFPTMLFNNRFFQFGIYPCCWTKVFKKEIIEKHIYDVDNRIRLGEDIAFTYPCLMECESLAFINEPLYHYRQNPESMTASYDERLADIYNLPYEALKESSEKLKVDLSEQLPYYLLYLTNFVIRNEANSSNPKTKLEIDNVLYQLINYRFLLSEMTRINLMFLPKHTKFLVFALNKKSVVLIKIYMELLKRFI